MDRIQIIRHKCCNKIFAACAEPFCYEDTDWKKKLRTYINMGNVIVETIDNEEVKFGTCECAFNRLATIDIKSAI